MCHARVTRSEESRLHRGKARPAPDRAPAGGQSLGCVVDFVRTDYTFLVKNGSECIVHVDVFVKTR